MRPRVELLYDVARVDMLIDTLDIDQCRAALRHIALYAASDADGPPLAASSALWAGLADALGAPLVRRREQVAHLSATRAAVRARRAS